jgi:hypothetical protein
MHYMAIKRRDSPRSGNYDAQVQRVLRARLPARSSNLALRHLGCSLEDLQRHLEEQFEPGMSWQNYGTHGWQIDHVVPLASSNDYFERTKLHHYSNLRPMWAKQNQAKGSRKVWSAPPDSNFAVALTMETLRLNVSEGRPFSVATARANGCSSALLSYHEKVGTLIRLGRGTFMFPGDQLDFCHSAAFLQQADPTIHLGAESALQWHKGIQLEAISEPLVLCSQSRKRLPRWFTDSFDVEHIQRKVFGGDSPTFSFDLTTAEPLSSGMNIAVAEMALVQVLADVGVRLSREQATEIVASFESVDSNKLIEVLDRARSVKVHRLMRQISANLCLPWATDLNTRWKPRSGGKRWSRRCKDGTYLNLARE